MRGRALEKGSEALRALRALGLGLVLGLALGVLSRPTPRI
jgi:hypothetical protein